MTPLDLDLLVDIDGTIESSQYLHVGREPDATGNNLSWRIEERPLRSKLIDANGFDEDTLFAIRQIASGIDEGLALVVEHEGALVGLLIAQADPSSQVLHVRDLRVDFDCRRQGLGTALLYRAIAEAREQGLRAVKVVTRTSNHPAARFLRKSGFDLAGLDSHLHSNHDLVKEAVALFWYAALD